ncbi:hypothetical protein NBRC116590_16880 [Pelagimonas sp. KU-00592-HH]|uniref:DUF3800 domain-containing protein n=1 Tax=Pelagimonas sp. KU-00592-HH TaxID=3127651 RepID=UPI003103B525
MCLSLSQIDAQLIRPGQTLVFVDETEFQGQEVPELVPDLRVVVGLEIASDHYSEIRSRMIERLERLGVGEFHAAEIVNPKGNSSWRNVEYYERVEALSLLGALIEQANASMRYAWVSHEDYSDIRSRMQGSRHGDPRLDRNTALKRFALRSLVLEHREENRPIAILVDQDRPRNSIVVDRSEDVPWLIGGGILTAPSHLVHGIQIADALAYGIGRWFRKRGGFDMGTVSELDKAAIGPLAALNGRSSSLF